MPEQLIEVLYVSRRLRSIPDDQLVDEIALPSIRSNRTQDITGCLWFDPVHFVQVLEGPREAVESLVAKIQADPRLTAVRVGRRRKLILRTCERFSLKVLRHFRDDAVAGLPHAVFGTDGGGPVVPETALDACVASLAISPQAAEAADLS